MKTTMARWARVLLGVLAWLCAPWGVTAHAAGDLDSGMAEVVGADSVRARAAVEAFKAKAEIRALPALQALDDGNLRIDAAGNLFIEADGKLTPALEGRPAAKIGAVRAPSVDNGLRRQLLPALALLKLSSPDREVRLNAADELSKRPSDDVAPAMKTALAKEKDSKIREKLELALAQLDLKSSEPRHRLSALEIIRKSGDVGFKAELENMLGRSGRPPT